MFDEGGVLGVGFAVDQGLGEAVDFGLGDQSGLKTVYPHPIANHRHDGADPQRQTQSFEAEDHHVPHRKSVMMIPKVACRNL